MAVRSLGVIADAAAAVVALHPLRKRILDLLTEPDSSAGVARRLGLPRQKVNYHVRQLAAAGLLEFVQARRAGNRMERVFRATASSWVIAPGTLGAAGADPRALPEDASTSAVQVALAARTIQELSATRARAAAAGRRVPVVAVDAEVRFASIEAQEAFATELEATMLAVISRHHRAGVPGGRTFRVLIGAYPKPGGPT